MSLWFEWTWWFQARCTTSKPSCAQNSCGDLPPPQPPLNLGLSKTGVTINRVLHGHCSFSLWATKYMGHILLATPKQQWKKIKTMEWPQPGLRMGQNWWSCSPGKPNNRGVLVGTELLLQHYTEQSTVPAEPGLTRKKSAIQVLTNKYSCCTCLTSLIEIWNGSDRKVYDFSNSRKHWFIEFWF